MGTGSKECRAVYSTGPPTFLREDDLVDDDVAAVNLKLGQLLRLVVDGSSGSVEVWLVQVSSQHVALAPPSACLHHACACSPSRGRI